MNRRIAAGAGISLGTALLAPGVAQADDFKVTNLNDAGAGSLRGAIEEANANPGADRVLFKSKLSGTIDVTSGALPVGFGDLQILGPGARQLTVDADGNSIVMFLFGGAVDVTVSDLTITGGSGSFGGGIDGFGDIHLTVRRSTITGNEALSGGPLAMSGGGIYVGGDPGASLVVDSSTISGNSAQYGGGVYADGDSGLMNVTVTNSTISGNSANGGAAIFASYAATEVRNSTIARNTARYFNGGIGAYQSPVELRGTVVGANTGDDDVHDYGPGVSFDGAFNLVEELGKVPAFGSHNIFGSGPKLKPLRNNGGPTDTHALKRKSKAKDKGPSDAPKSDQRGAPRKGKPDIGAYELVKCEGVVVNRVGTGKKDKLKGTKKADGMLGLGGNDVLKGKKGNDGLCGGKGKDKLKGGRGKDKLNGGPGKDKEIQ